jgi:hypothetical protein
MRIAIIGCGWVGCHLAHKLKSEHDVILFEKNDEIFSETSYKNQNRLHYGYHYARNHNTRNLCKTTFYKFIEEYGFCVNNVNTNLYCVAKKSSLIDIETYLKIFDDYPIYSISHNFINTDGCILTNEKHIDFEKAKSFFEKELSHLIKYQFIDKSKLENLKENYDLVIDATNNFMGLITDDCFYELTLSLIYDKINLTNFDALTFVDGDLFSIYPYRDSKYTLTDVKLTSLKKFLTVDDMNFWKKSISDNYISNKVIEFESRVKVFMPDFNKYFKYNSYFISVKSKFNDDSGNRYPVIKSNGNVISCFTGKIQGIYVIEDYIKTIIDNEKNTNLF